MNVEDMEQILADWYYIVLSYQANWLSAPLSSQEVSVVLLEQTAKFITSLNELIPMKSSTVNYTVNFIKATRIQWEYCQ